MSGGATWAQSADVIKIGFITRAPARSPRLASPTRFVLELARKALADGLSAGGKTYKVEILDRDTQSDPEPRRTTRQDR